MARERYCRICGGWHDVDNWPHNCLPAAPQRSRHLSAPMVIGDTMDPVKSMLDGQMYDSKRALRATYRQAGVTEVGNDLPKDKPMYKPKPKPDRQAIRGSLEKAFSQVGLGA